MLAVAAAAIVVRTPGSFLLLAAAPVVTIVLNGLVLRRGTTMRPLWWLLGAALGGGLMAVVIHPEAAAGAPSVAVAAVMVCWTIAVASAPRPSRTAAHVVNGLYGGLLVSWAIAIGEVVTGIKLLPVLYPRANTVAAVLKNRFYVTATFPNYNDFSIALVMLGVIVMCKLAFQPRVHPLTVVFRWTVLGTSGFLIASMGSRGALVSLLAGAGVVAIVSARVHHAWLMRRAVLLPAALIAAITGAGVVLSPYVQDHSTALRGMIADNIAAMMADEPSSFWFGWGSYPRFAADALNHFGPILMDPHNLLLEWIIWFGIGAAVAFVVAWLVLVVCGLLGGLVPHTWQGTSALVVAVLFPILGIVPSSTLRYHLVWLWFIAAFAGLGEMRRHRSQAKRRRAADTPSANAIANNATTTAPTTAAASLRVDDIDEAAGAGGAGESTTTK